MRRFNGILRSVLAIGTGTAFIAACMSGPPEIISGNELFGEKPEIERLRYFDEINATDALRATGLTGEGVYVTIMGEAVDTDHPDINQRVVAQYNAFANADRMLKGDGNKPYRSELYGKNDGHGTHIAGTIAAECDQIGLQGVACGARLDVYDLGAYDNTDRFELENWGQAGEESRFILAFSHALDDVSRRGHSRITTGSFNLEAPAALLDRDASLAGLRIAEIMERVESQKIKNVPQLLSSGLVRLAPEEDRQDILATIDDAGGDEEFALGLMLPYSVEWGQLVDAIARYQAKDGVYIITESNNVFGSRTSVMNAMPSIDERVDPDLWISISMVVPENIDEFESVETFVPSRYISPINSCGKLASDYCIVTPSYSVLSTMTERTAFWGGPPLVELDGRLYQSLDGHSMGAPMVAAALALMQERNERDHLGLSMKDMVRILKDSANRNFPGYDPKQHGRGMLDVKAALDAMVLRRAAP